MTHVPPTDVANGEYRLHWAEPAEPRPGLPADGEMVGGWVGSDDPQALKRYAGEREWPRGTILMLTLKLPDREALLKAHLRPEDLAGWDANAFEMPASTAQPVAHRPPSRARLDFYDAIRKAIAQALEDRIVSRDMGDALLLAAQDAVRESSRSRRAASGPVAVTRPA